jgi:rubredoxin
MILRCSICSYIYDADVVDHPTLHGDVEVRGVCPTCIAKEGLPS